MYVFKDLGYSFRLGCSKNFQAVLSIIHKCVYFKRVIFKKCRSQFLNVKPYNSINNVSKPN